MSDVLTIIAVTLFAYAATNLDNFTVLVALLARFPGQVVWVIAGHMLVVTILVFAARGLGDVAAYAPVQFVGFLGIVPIAIGLFWLYRLWRPATDADQPAVTVSGKAVLFVTAATLLGNGIDSLLTLAVVFADTAPRLDWVVMVVVELAALALGFMALYGLGNAAIGPLINRYAARVAPFVMIAIGVYVVANTATDTL